MRDAPLHLRPLPVILVFVGGGGGTLARYLLGLVIPTLAGFPLATFLVNLVGAFALGLLLEGLLRGGNDVGGRQRVRLLLGPGFLGGFTTYSSLCVETALLTEDGRYLTGAGYAAASLIFGVAAAATGVWVAANVIRVPEAVPGSTRSSVTSTKVLHLAQPLPRAQPPGAWVDPDAEHLDGGRGEDER